MRAKFIMEMGTPSRARRETLLHFIVVLDLTTNEHHSVCEPQVLPLEKSTAGEVDVDLCFQTCKWCIPPGVGIGSFGTSKSFSSQREIKMPGRVSHWFKFSCEVLSATLIHKTSSRTVEILTYQSQYLTGSNLSMWWYHATSIHHNHVHTCKRTAVVPQ